ncbi:SDR family NAD(P)-dependent oxidoreductase [Pelagibius sp. Alg239-R121]|uniref:SDR family NAD(P)-dependent oxidoreductase n=1 Tax=Pelagibius sp. Alg239-R121 TaxID=2993448 RepID=UPI0024A66BF3|nr:SDR family oxidoreductase [Pelagibius sp. Alg239-R121]
MTFQGKTAVVTGAGGGMGLAITQGLLAEGAMVTAIDVKPCPAELLQEGGSFQFLAGDLTDDAFVADAMQRAFDQQGSLDCLVNAAGVLWFDRDVSMVEIDLDVWDKVLEIDLKTIVHTTRHAVPLMKKSQSGAMVHIASTQALRGDDKPQDAYQASKAAILSLSKSLAIQFAGDGIRSNCVVPGPCESPMQARWVGNPDSKKATAGVIPLGRVGQPQDIADAVLFLLSDKASYITGTDLIVDGGLTARP